MNKILTILGLLCFLGLGFAGYSNAADFIARGEFTSCEATDLIGTQVKSPEGEVVGSISEFLFDPHGLPVLAILYQSELAGLDAARHVAVPFTALSVSEIKPGELTAVLNVETEKLLAAPSFDRKKDLNFNRWAGIYQYFGQQPYWTEMESEEAAPAGGSR